MTFNIKETIDPDESNIDMEENESLNFGHISEEKSVLVANEDGRYPCRFCTKTFSFRTGVKLHEKLHTGEGLVACDQCDLTFTR